jgi:two-component system, chemotaxis family, response regulator PixH
LLKGACVIVALDSKKILVVEDEPDTAEMFAEMLRLRGYRVYKSNGSASAMRQLALDKPDAVVLDIMMPGISGLEVLHYMRREPAFEKIPVVVVSAKSLLSDIKDGMDAGATLYLTKPVAYSELTAAVEDVIQKGIPNTEG